MFREIMAIVVIMHAYPFTFVECKRTRSVIKFVNVKAPPISRNTFKQDIIKVCNRENEKLKGRFTLWGGRICLTLDLWSLIPIND